MVKKKEAIQPEINIGLVGHVDHGKTTLTEKLSGKWTDTHSEEIKRGITIRLGYADSIFRKCKKCRGTTAYTVKEKCKKCESESKILRKVSFVDAPGHESLMATMLAGATIIDGALLLIAANERCPQPQTREHLMALEISGIKNVIIVQNKIDIVTEEEATTNYEQIKEFIKDTSYKDAPIIPISARLGINIDALIEAIEKYIPTPKRDPKADPVMFIARSFDINKPGIIAEQLVGGVLGGSLKQGILKSGQEIEIRPGYKVIEKNQAVWKPINTKILDLKTGGLSTKQVGPGGSIGVLTSLDPSIVKSDQLTGNIVGSPGKLPKVWYKVELETNLLERVVGAKEDLTVEPIKMSEALMLNVNSAATVGIVTKLHKKKISCTLKLPVCAEPGSRVTISRRIGNRFRLIGYGVIQ
ncbi:translation initiation factor IF-2 subunit gamma [Candidatus Woesearchaeota archaeon]|nr:translation initiation factor IF-2 subunit gamma [Candidatus Woesearchaeota archaeon]